MTTLDDAAERQINAILHWWIESDARVNEVVRRAWTEATEAAAKKCEAIAEQHGDKWRVGTAVSGAEECAAAIRGKG